MKSDARSGRVLIVDDEEDKCEFMTMALERQGIDCVAVTSPLRALELVAEEDFDLVLTDVGMDEMSGLEVCERMLGTRPDLVVIVVTGQGNIETVIAAMRTGAFDFLVKPVDAK